MQLQLTPVTEQNRDLLFPLVRSANAAAKIDVWRRFVTQQLERTDDSGLLAARDANGVYVGLACYRTFADVRHEKVLEISHFASAGLTRAGDVTLSILDRLEKEALKLGCKAVHICLDTPPAERTTPFFPSGDAAILQTVTRNLKDVGYEQDAVRLCKHLEQACDIGAH